MDLDIENLNWPMRRINDSITVFHAVQQRFRVRRRFICETPRKCEGRIQNKPGHSLPATLVYQILDLQAAKRNSLTQFADTGRSFFRRIGAGAKAHESLIGR